MPGSLSNMFFFFSLIAACAFRYNGLSFVYLIYLLLIPLFSEPTKTTMQGEIFIASFFRMCGGHSTCKSLCVVEGEVLNIFPSLSELPYNTYCTFPDTVVSLYGGFGAEGPSCRSFPRVQQGCLTVVLEDPFYGIISPGILTRSG